MLNKLLSIGKDVIIKVVKASINSITHLLMPPFCIACKTFDIHTAHFMCDQCSKKIIPLVSITLPVTTTQNLTVFAAAAYTFPVKSLILAKQHQDIGACKAIGHLICEKTDIQSYQFDLILPVPLHWSRYANRGYNQATEISFYLSQKMGIPVVHLIKRNKATALQLTLSKDERIDNVKDAFVIADYTYKETFKYKRILIVDDLLTTGSTLKAVAKACLPLQPIDLKAVVGARVV